MLIPDTGLVVLHPVLLHKDPGFFLEGKRTVVLLLPGDVTQGFFHTGLA